MLDPVTLTLIGAGLAGGIATYGALSSRSKALADRRRLRDKYRREDRAAELERTLGEKAVSEKRQKLVENLRELQKLGAEEHANEMTKLVTQGRQSTNDASMMTMMQLLQSTGQMGEQMNAGNQALMMPLSWYLNRL